MNIWKVSTTQPTTISKIAKAITKSKWVIKVVDRLMDFNVAEYRKLIDTVSDLVCNWTLRNTVCEVWCGIKEVYLELSRRAMKIVFPFPTPYLCETRFSSYVSIKI